MKLANRHWVVLALLLLLVVIGLWIRYPGADIGWSLRDYDRLGEMLFDDICLVLEFLRVRLQLRLDVRGDFDGQLRSVNLGRNLFHRIEIVNAVKSVFRNVDVRILQSVRQPSALGWIRFQRVNIFHAHRERL